MVMDYDEKKCDCCKCVYPLDSFRVFAKEKDLRRHGECRHCEQSKQNARRIVSRKQSRRIEELERKLSVAVEALRFYGDTDKWDCDWIHCQRMYFHLEEAVGGKRARTALEKIKELEK